MRFYLDPEQPITSDYNAPRPTTMGRHLAWDHPCPVATPIYAPERVEVRYQIIRQHGDWMPDLSWPDGTWWPYSRYYEWVYGGVAVCFGRTYTYVFCHLEPAYIYERWHVTGKQADLHKMRFKTADGVIDYSKYVYPELNWEPIEVEEGEFIAPTGMAGYDTESHLHMQVMVAGRGRHTQVDPATVWPGQYARLCAVKNRP